MSHNPRRSQRMTPQQIPTKAASVPRAGRQAQSRDPQSVPFISLCMIARDEEPRIAACLRSIAAWVDEMIVVDTGSTDRTREIALECGARVYTMPWPESFAAARNESLRFACGQWIFWMDADDVISAECGQMLRELALRHSSADAAYHVQVRIPAGPGEFNDSLVDHVKLFPNRRELRFEHRIHEQILPALRRVGLPVHFSDVFVTHQNYDRSPEGQAKKRARDYRLLQLDLAEHPDHPFVLFNLGMTYLYGTREYAAAAQYLRRSLSQSHPSDSIVRKAYAMLATAHLCDGDADAALAANEEGRGHYPDDAELLLQAGELYQQSGKLPEARIALERLVSGEEQEHYRSAPTGLRTSRGWHELAMIYRRLGDPHHAIRMLAEIARRHPAYLPARLDLADTLYGIGKYDRARRVAEAIPDHPTLRAARTELLNRPWPTQPSGDNSGRSAEKTPPIPINRDAATTPVKGLDPEPEDSFEFAGHVYPYFVHPYNSTASNERCVELALAMRLARGGGGDLLEIGNVLAHYGVRGHEVVDRYEEAPEVRNQDVEDFLPSGKFDRIISISTLEHVGQDQDRTDPEKAVRVLERLRSWLRPAGQMLVTVPLGYHSTLDAFIRTGRTGTAVHYLRRVNAENEWQQIDAGEVGSPRYGAPFSQGNVIAVLSIGLFD